MTPAQPNATGRRSLSALVLLVLAVGACKGSEGRANGAVAAGPEKAMMETAGPVVIAAPSGAYVGGAVASGGTVSGVVSLASPLAPTEPVATGRDEAVCGATIADSSVVQSGTGLGNAVVWLDGVRKGRPVPLEKRIELESDRCTLVPRVQGAMVGGAVNVIGHDPFRQHLRFIAGGERAPRAGVLLGKDEQVIPTELPLKTPGLVIVRDIDHGWPRAYLAVFDHPYFAVTRPDGTFRIDSVPAGSYTLVTWHERTGRAEQKISVGAGAVATVKVAVKGK